MDGGGDGIVRSALTVAFGVGGLNAIDTGWIGPVYKAIKNVDAVAAATA